MGISLLVVFAHAIHIAMCFLGLVRSIVVLRSHIIPMGVGFDMRRISSNAIFVKTNPHAC